MKVKRLWIAAISACLFAGTIAGTAAQDGGPASDIESFKTRVVEPGVVRILDDNAGHDLTRKWPDQRRDINRVAVSPSGEVWLSITASGSDNDKLDGARLWPLGREATYGPKDGIGKHHGRLFFDEQGQLWVLGSRPAFFDGEEWDSSAAKRSVVAPDGTVWLSGRGLGVESWDGTTLTPHLENTFTDTLFASPDGTIGVNAWNGVYLYDGAEWDLANHADGRRAVPEDGTLAVLLDDRKGMRIFQDGASATVLKGNRLDEIAGAPDGSVWAVGGVGKANGGVYRVDPSEVFAAQAQAQADTAAEAETMDEEAEG
jgi:hypothetical protein